MKKVIVLTGDLASGKSSLADSLSLALAIPAFKKDIIKERYCDLYGYTTREENRVLSIKATDYMIDAFKQFARQGNELILEANFRKNELERIKDIADEYEYDVRLLVLRGDIEVLYQRFLARLPNRHKAHMSLHLDESIDRFKEYIEEQRREDVIFLPHIIDTTKKSAKEILEIALKICG